MKNKKGCTVINKQYFGCCKCKENRCHTENGEPTDDDGVVKDNDGTDTTPKLSGLKYMQLFADEQMSIAVDQKVYFNNRSFGDLDFTQNGTLKLEPGVYQMSICCELGNQNGILQSAYVGLSLYDLLSKTRVGFACGRITGKTEDYLSSADGCGIFQITQPAELCMTCINVKGNAYVISIHASVIKIAEIPA